MQRDRKAGTRRVKYNVVGSLDLRELRRPIEDILSPANIGPNSLQLTDVTRASDRYEADQSLYGVFSSIQVDTYEKWRFGGGIRFESNEQNVVTKKADGTDGDISGSIDKSSFLPTVNAVYMIDDASQVRANVARTVSRPDFREFSPAPFFDLSLDVESSGNPLLEQGAIDHLDVRYELYQGEDYTISSGVYYKRLDRPIERVFVPGTGGLLSFENAESAKVYGLELEGFQSLGFYRDEWADFRVSGNVTLSRSSVDLGSTGIAQTSRSRPLQGQSDVLVNVSFGYEPPEGSTGIKSVGFNVGYNMASDRISQVGVLGFPDVEEERFHDVSLSFSAPIAEAFKLNFRIGNLLDESVRFSQGGQTVRQYKPGTEFSASLQWLR
jgi:outer membrane receptor protein involved in Fe transport